MLIDGQKWACEACIRGHRVTSCKHHGIPSSPISPFSSINLTDPDRPLIRIKRKGRPFATCTICNSNPCSSPTEHTRLKREAELKSPSSKVTHTHHTLHTTKKPAGRPSAQAKNKKKCPRRGADMSFSVLRNIPRGDCTRVITIRMDSCLLRPGRRVWVRRGSTKTSATRVRRRLPSEARVPRRHLLRHRLLSPRPRERSMSIVSLAVTPSARATGLARRHLEWNLNVRVVHSLLPV